jgi:uncharacterized membrane protein YccC
VPAILQTAAAALAAWWLGILLLPTERPAFASIAAVICLGATYGQRRSRAVELIGGVVLGITVASLLLVLIGTGPWQIAVLVVLAMSAALLFRGGELLVSEAAISAILLASYQTTDGFSADRILEGVIGGGVGLAVASLLLPPDPVAMVGQVAQSLFGKLGRTLEQTAAALQESDPARAESALAAARGIDEDVEELERVLIAASETARFAPARRGGLPHVQRYEATMPQLDFAIRNARVLVGPAIILTTLVLAFGLGVTVFSDLPSLRMFGFVCGTTLVASLLADLVFLPGLIMLIRKIWPHRATSV